MRELREFIRSRLLPLDSYRPQDPEPAEHAPAAVLVPLIERPEGLSVLLTLRTKHLRKHAGQIDQFRIEPHLFLRLAQGGLPRHLAGLRTTAGQGDLAGLSETFWARSGYLITPVVGFVSPDLSLTPNPDEVDEVFEVPFEFIMDAGNHQIAVREFSDGVSRETLVMPFRDRHIWGMTAMMLRALHARLYGEPVV